MNWKDLFAPDFKLVIAVIAFMTAFFQWRKSKEESKSFRQQLISLLHHSEGIATSLRSILHSARRGSFSSVQDVASAVESAAQNAESLFFGLIESKIGGIPIKGDLDKKYSEWADLELERKKLPLRDFLKKQRSVPKETKK